MKRFLLGCFLALFCVSAFADEINIHFEKDSQPTKTRSLSMEPTATHDENVVHIYYSDYLLENLQVTVKDLSGNTVYSNVVSVSYDHPYLFILDNVESGDYILELNYGNKAIYGYFSI